MHTTATSTRRRNTLRLSSFDYSQAGAYFVTVCTHRQECIFGNIRNGVMQLNELGGLVAQEWQQSTAPYPSMALDAWVVMPNHLHGIVIVEECATQPQAMWRLAAKRGRRNMALPKWIGRFKMLSAKHVNRVRNTPGKPLWQRNYWEHVVRNDSDMARIREYIHNNPARWELDRLFVP
ncbi:MAG: transposase [Porticoccaceae bacterium]